MISRSYVAPKGWALEKLGNHTHKVGSGTTPKGGSKVYVAKGIPLIRSQNVRKGRLDLTDVVYITDVQHEKMSNSKVEKYDVLLNITGASIGRCAAVQELSGEANVNQHVCIIRTNESLCNEYLSQLINSGLGQDQIFKLQAGGNREGLNFQQIREFILPIPPVFEQQKIANILSIVDKKIDLIDQKIQLTQTLKKGLMQKLFSEGVGTQDADGNWIPHQEFVDSPLGRIPKGWSVGSLGEFNVLIEDGDRGNAYPKQADFSKDGYCLFLSAKNVTKSGLSFKDCQFISKEKDEQLRKGRVKPSDIVITTRGSVGHKGLFEESGYQSVRINSGMAIIRSAFNECLFSFFWRFKRLSRYLLASLSINKGSNMGWVPCFQSKLLRLPAA